MFPYYHYPSPSDPYARFSSPADSDYLRALAEERAAREQYAAARRAQEEARQRAARARAARRAYVSPYSSYHDDGLYDDLDLDMDLDENPYYPRQRPLSFADSQRPEESAFYPRQRPLSFVDGQRPYGLGLNSYSPYQQRALLEEQRRREMLEEQRRRELLELEREREKERRRLEEERIRKILQEEREREEAARQKLLEEERLRRALEEERVRRAIEEERLRRALREEEEARKERERAQLRSQQASLEPLLRALGFVPANSGSDSESEKERTGRPLRTQNSTRRAGAPSRSPIRPYPFGQTSTPNARRSTDSVPATKESTSTTIPITSPKPAAKPAPAPAPASSSPKSNTPKSTPPPPVKPTAEQIAAAEKIQEAYRAHAARKQALKAVSGLRKRFLAARSGFTLPTTLDYDIPTNGRVPTSVVIDPATAPSPAALDSEEDPFENVPKLAYTPTNAPLHAYEEELNRILSALDAVESRGDQGVRAARRELARTVECEAERVERWRAVVWNWWTQREAEKEKATSASVPESTESEQKMDVEPTVEVPAVPSQAEQGTATASEPAPMEVEAVAPVSSTEPSHEPSSPPHEPTSIPSPEPPAPVAVEAAESPAPEVDIPDAADAPESELVPPVIVVEPPSRAEPAVVAEDVQDGEVVVVEDLEPTSIADRPPTPALSHEETEMEVETELEPEEVRTPPQGEHAPLVAVDAPLSVPAGQEAAMENVRREEEAQEKRSASAVEADLQDFVKV